MAGCPDAVREPSPQSRRVPRLLARAEPSLDLGIAQVGVALDKGPRVIEESGYFLVRH